MHKPNTPRAWNEHTARCRRRKLTLDQEEWKLRLWNLIARQDKTPEEAEALMNTHYRLGNPRPHAAWRDQRLKPRLTPSQADHLMTKLMNGTAPNDIRNHFASRGGRINRYRRRMSYNDALRYLLMNCSVLGTYDDISAWSDDPTTLQYVDQARRYNA